MFIRLQLCRWINSKSDMIRNILFTDGAYFTLDEVNNTRNSHLWDRDNPLGTVASNYQHHFSVNVWCGVIGDQLTGLYIFPRRLAGDIYATLCTLESHSNPLLQHLPRDSVIRRIKRRWPADL